jgi:hypothetical protein
MPQALEFLRVVPSALALRVLRHDDHLHSEHAPLRHSASRRGSVDCRDEPRASWSAWPSTAPSRLPMTASRSKSRRGPRSSTGSSSRDRRIAPEG